MAPSPTGFFHIGSARTALYNWLFAKHASGKFVLRVEDTDVKRSSEDMIQVILDGMKWLGLDWDEIYYQSKRLTLYTNHVKTLIDKGLAYYCYCDPKELERERLDAYERKINWQYDRRCLKLSPAEHETKQKANLPRAIRFLVPGRTVSFKDIVHGEINREAKDIEDFVIMRHDDTPTYNFACVIDDHDMDISHVIRGAEHINNTPKQLLLYEALSWPAPSFAHLPLILGKDKSKLSKRHGAVSIMGYKDQGFLPEAVFNYITLLGWSPGDNEEIMDQAKLIERFTLERINTANAIFDIEKLEWMNQQYIMRKSRKELAELIEPFIINSRLMTAAQLQDKSEWLQAVGEQMKPRLKTLGDIKNASYFFIDNFVYDEMALNKHLNDKTMALMKKYLTELKSLPDIEFKAQRIETDLKDLVRNWNIKIKEIVHPLRVFVTGCTGGPGLYEILELVGKQKVIERIERFVK